MKMLKNGNGYAFDGAKIIFSNFSGRPDKYNAEGKRNFCIVIDDPDDAEALKAEGWNIKELRPRDEGDEASHYLQVKINLGSHRPPHIYMVNSRNVPVEVDEDTIDNLDSADIVSADLVVRPYEWEPGRISAYLRELYVVIAEDYFGSKYARDEGPAEDPDYLPF